MKNYNYYISWLNKNYPNLTVNKLGAGVDGCVYEFVDNKVIKFSQSDNIPYIFSILKSLTIDNNLYVKVHDYNLLTEVKGSYYYIMDKLNPISEDEKKVFHSIISHEDRGIIKNISEGKIKKILDGLSLGLDFDKEKIILFCRAIRASNLFQRDCHERNIMKDNNGYFRFIDLERIEEK